MGSESRPGPKGSGTRVLRVERAVREELASLVGEEVRDPGASGAIVTRVEMAKDLRSAKVYVRLLEGGDDPARRRAVTDALHRASGMLRSELTQRLGLRFAPDLRFFYDEGADRKQRIDEILAEIEAEKGRRGSS